MKNNKNIPENLSNECNPDECKEFTKMFTDIFIEACFNTIIESHLTMMIGKTGNKYAKPHPFIGLYACEIKQSDPYFHIIDQKNKKKRDKFLAWKEKNPGKEVPPEIDYEPQPHLGIKESKNFVEVLLFFESKCISYMKFPANLYYELMPDEDLNFLKNLARFMVNGMKLNRSVN